MDHGVQIRFINDLYENGGGQPVSQPKAKTKTQTASKYGVAVRVQGIDGHPYVVLKDGKKGDSYGVQLKTQYSAHNSLPRKREKADSGREGGHGGGGEQAGLLRRAQSHGSLLDRDGHASSEDFQLSRPPGDGKSGSYGNLDAGIGVRDDGEQGWHVSDRERKMWHGSYQSGLNTSLGSVRDSPEPPPQQNELNYNREMSVNRLRNRFDGVNDGSQQRGLPPPQQHPRAASPLNTPNPYSVPPSSTHSSLGRSQGAVRGPGRPANQWTAVEPPQRNPTEAQVRVQSFVVGY